MKANAVCAGYIQLVFFDDVLNEVVTLGGAGFANDRESDAAWLNVPAFPGDTSFMADRLNAHGDIVDDKPVSAETCERLTGRPIDQLLAAGRTALRAELSLTSN